MVHWIIGQIGSAYADIDRAIETAADHADRTETPCGVWARDGWHIASEVAPDIDETDTRETDGWALLAVVNPKPHLACHGGA